MRSQAKKELQSLTDQRSAIDRKIIGLEEQTIKGLDAVCGADAEPALNRQNVAPLPVPPHLAGLLALGITDAVRKIFENSGLLLLTPVAVRDQLAMYGYELPKDNLVAAIHAVVHRLEANSEIISTLGEDGTKGFRWHNPIERAIQQQRALEIEAQHAKDIAEEEMRKLTNAVGRYVRKIADDKK